MVGDTRRRLEDQPRSRLEQRLGMLGRPGVPPGALQFIEQVLPCTGSVPRFRRFRRSEMVETRRLELLTLSLQRRCSAN
jgi:hypothetical protein